MPELSGAEAKRILDQLKKEIQAGLVGQAELVDGLLTCLLAEGHALIEGVPGLAKTRAVNLLSRMCRLEFKRLQFTPDLLPADVVGTRIYNHLNASFETKKGPIFANFILADEINRAPAKVQSALLETMQERQVTIGDQSFQVPRPFFVFATMNPVEQEGTYPLPEAQIDRFLMKLVVSYPSREEEQSIVKMIMNETNLPDVPHVVDGPTLLALQEATRRVFIEEKLIKYITDLVFASRFPSEYGLKIDNMIQYGASPRASIALAQVARARALINGEKAVMPEDIKAAVNDVMRHRIIPTYQAEAEGIRSEEILRRILESVKVP